MASPRRKTSQHDFFEGSAPHQAAAEVIPMPASEPQTSERQAKASSPTIRVGEMLKRERERRGYDLQQIADYLCIRRSLLTALEESHYEQFPADAYVIGFLRSYAELIGINGQEAINQYRQEMAGRRRKPDLVLPTPVSEGRAPTAVIMGAAAFASLLIYILWYAFSTSNRTTVTTPAPLPTASEIAPEQTSPAASGAETLSNSIPSGIALSGPAPAQKTLSSSAPTTPSVPTYTPPAPAAVTTAVAPAARDTPHILIKADQSSWVLISNDRGQTVYDRVMKPGESYVVPDTPGLTLTTGNGAGIVLALDGVDLPRLSTTTSHIVRNVPLETGALRMLPPAQ